MFGAVPRVGPTTPGLRNPPAQPETNAARNNAALTAIQVRRRRGAATENIRNATSMRRVSAMARSGAKLCGRSHGTGITTECEGAVVVTVVVTVTGALSVNEFDDGVQVLAGMTLLQETVTEPLNPPAGATDSANIADWPAETVAEVEPPGGTEMMTSVPSPDRVTA